MILPNRPLTICDVTHFIFYFFFKTFMQGQPTYTPRLIAIDLKGSLNTLRAEGVLYDVPVQEEDIKW